MTMIVWKGNCFNELDPHGISNIVNDPRATEFSDDIFRDGLFNGISMRMIIHLLFMKAAYASSGRHARKIKPCCGTPRFRCVVINANEILEN